MKSRAKATSLAANGSPDALALEQGEQGELIYYSEAIVLVPSVDTESPQG